jgi:hypothetical protein
MPPDLFRIYSGFCQDDRAKDGYFRSDQPAACIAHLLANPDWLAITPCLQLVGIADSYSPPLTDRLSVIPIDKPTKHHQLRAVGNATNLRH